MAEKNSDLIPEKLRKSSKGVEEHSRRAIEHVHEAQGHMESEAHKAERSRRLPQGEKEAIREAYEMGKKSTTYAEKSHEESIELSRQFRETGKQMKAAEKAIKESDAAVEKQRSKGKKE